MKPKPELVAPAGGFMAGAYAFKAGADAVYAGLRDFSARKSAQNFTFTELGKMKNLAVEAGRKVYVAMNTVILDRELPVFLHAVEKLVRMEIDALIIQDFGILSVLRDYFPGIRLHASTQMAVHNGYGVRKASELGIRRIVLPRELPLISVRKLESMHPEMEFEVFIHGALCYSWSGLCLASGLLAGRSANRGECAQLCRLPFESGGKHGYHLSCRDLFAGKQVMKLVSAGINALKIEGRMKPPEYVDNAVRLYRAIIDRGGRMDEREYQDLAARAGFCFSREQTKGFLFGAKATEMITRDHPRSIGRRIGNVEESDDAGFSFRTGSDLAVNDVLKVLTGDPQTPPLRIAVGRMTVCGQPVKKAPAGAFVTVECGSPPARGREVHKAYAKDLELAGIRHDRFNVFRTLLPVRIRFENGPESGLDFSFTRGGQDRRFHYPVAQGASEDLALTGLEIKRLFHGKWSESYQLEVTDFQTGSQTDPVVPANLIRRIRTGFLNDLDKLDRQEDTDKTASILTDNRTCSSPACSDSIDGFFRFISGRENLNPGHGVNPFWRGGKQRTDTLASFGDSVFLPLEPVTVKNDRNCFLKIARFADGNPEKRIHIGINNIAHLKAVEPLTHFPHVSFFIDFYFYLANHLTAKYCLDHLGKIDFGYFWIEGRTKDYDALKNAVAFPLFTVGKNFTAPYFYHAGDFAKESLGLQWAFPGKRILRLNHGQMHLSVCRSIHDTWIFPDGNG
jgi:U32 family peptidase